MRPVFQLPLMPWGFPTSTLIAEGSKSVVSLKLVRHPHISWSPVTLLGLRRTEGLKTFHQGSPVRELKLETATSQAFAENHPFLLLYALHEMFEVFEGGPISNWLQSGMLPVNKPRLPPSSSREGFQPISSVCRAENACAIWRNRHFFKKPSNQTALKKI